MFTNVFKNVFLAALVCLVAAVYVSAEEQTASANGSSAVSPIPQVRDTLDRMVQVVTAFPGDENTIERRAKLREIISPRFDFQAMAKSSLGPHWEKVTPAEQTEFADIFSDLLARTYLKRVENIRADTVRIEGERMGTPPITALVKTIVTYKGDKFPIDYKLYKTADSWKVYDVIIENIGLVLNYRNEFAGIIRKEQFSGLMRQLRKKAASD